MKDIKLTIEEIKKGCDFAEGFEYKASKYNSLDDQIRFSNGDYARRYDILSDEWKFDKLGDFLQRVIEGINNKFCYSDKRSKNGYHIRYSTDSICIMNYTEMETMYSSDEDFSIDQAKTQAIKYVLDKLK